MPSIPTVLLLHNRYREPGGEERSVQKIAALLADKGHSVEVLERSSESLQSVRGRAKAGAAMLAGGIDPQAIADAIGRSGAQIAHFHNLNPLFGSRAISAARSAGARVVAHLHNYRLFCAIAISYRDGAGCMRCHGRNTLPGVWLRCRGSFAEASAYAAGLSFHQLRILEQVDRFVVPSEAAAARLAAFGMPRDKLSVLPNFLRASEFASASEAGDGEHALFAGRLVEEKGGDTAIAAAAASRVPLVVAGSGHDRARLERVAQGADVSFAGHLSPQALADARRRAAFAVVPSRWHEPCPYAAIEFMAAGLPVLASDVGGLPEMVGPESSLPSREPERWAEAMGVLWQNREERRRRGEESLRRAHELFGSERFYSELMNVYERALAR